MRTEEITGLFSAKEGLLTRAERYFEVGPALAFKIPIFGVWIIWILANITALQRIWAVWAQAHTSQKKISVKEYKNG